jgi:nucleoside-diphosphate-sugar epimerase
MGAELILVTGGSGFVATHCIVQLLKAGYRVRTTLRSKGREPEVRAAVKQGGIDGGDQLSFVAADLSEDGGWKQAAEGCTYVLHVASPFPQKPPRDENELIVPAREGALRVLRAASDCGVRRVVMTSSFAAIGYGHSSSATSFTEKDWTDVNGPGTTAYVKSKTIAERAAWDFVAKEGKGLELSVVNPVGIFGPLLGRDIATSVLVVQSLMNRALPGCPRIWFGIVDVRDVADLHLRAMTHPAAAGERFLAVSGEPMSFQEIARLLKARMGENARRVPTGNLPNWFLRLAALFNPSVKLIVPELGKVKSASNEKAQHVLGWSPRSKEEALLATAQSLVGLGLVKTSAA